MRFRPLLFLFLLIALPACSSSRGPVGPSDGRPDYETFDPSPYDAEPPPAQRPPAQVDHDVPASVMDGRIDASSVTTRPAEPFTVEGFRVQVTSTEDRGQANRTASEVQSWWRSSRSGAPRVLADPLDVRVDFNSPYYRVRMGAFETRADAEEALAFIRRRFAEAFIVPATVTIYPGQD